MTTTFDALQRVLGRYAKIIPYVDLCILRNAIDVVHDLQHGENNHRIDTAIETRLYTSPLTKERFNDWRYGDAEELSE